MVVACFFHSKSPLRNQSIDFNRKIDQHFDTRSYHVIFGANQKKKKKQQLRPRDLLKERERKREQIACVQKIWWWKWMVIVHIKRGFSVFIHETMACIAWNLLLMNLINIFQLHFKKKLFLLLLTKSTKSDRDIRMLRFQLFCCVAAVFFDRLILFFCFYFLSSLLRRN